MELFFSALVDENVNFCLEKLAGFTPHWKLFILIRQTLHLYYKEQVLSPSANRSYLPFVYIFYQLNPCNPSITERSGSFHFDSLMAHSSSC